MKCPHCSGNHPASYKFCPVTGKEIDAHHGMKACSNPDCPDCGKYILPAEAKYCPRCGRPISDYGKAVESVRSCDSRIVMVCSGAAYIEVGKERDQKIRLKEGENVISVNESVNDYPELKYGFSMERDGHPERISEIDLSNYDTSEITDMSSMFSDCTSLVSLDLGGFDTSRVTDMNCMFFDCTSLVSLDLSGFDTDTSQVTDMNCMFDGCGSLKSLDLSGFDTSRVTDMINMFYGCSSLNSLDLSGFDTSRVKTRFMMFFGCPESIQEK